ncbi:nitric oxide-associated protein 1 isoform X2 [Takifugu rubripes]|uniref:nitric oxide-associated protein 1 isoform X2 n=1 Tax=Takifugu rubripes TaxID=31033 RepID=UPI0011455924|nr:nitric oxide-associated protein 1 isoform X2 [Takifugu rubripes]
MWSVFGTSVCRALWICVKGPHSRILSAGCAGCARGPRLTQRLRCTHATTVRSSTVDPELEEEFVFVDSTDPEEDLLPWSPVAPPTKPSARPSPRLRPLEQQLQMLSGAAQQEVEPDDLIQFHDVDFPLDDAIKATKKRRKRGGEKREHAPFGTPDVDQPFSDTCCPGCGAVLHCTAPEVPGYLPSEKFKVLLREGGLTGATCQRCHLLTHHHRAMSLQVSAEQYRAVVQNIQPLKALVLLIVDLLDIPDSIVPDLPELVGTNKHIIVLGNKIDLLPMDSPNYLQRIRRHLTQCCHDAGFGTQLADIHLISAKTGYGVEALVSSLQRSWKYKGDVYLVGLANAGKSTLFNTLLESDYCKSRASDVVHKATISPWPGRVGRTFLSSVRMRREEIEFDPDSLAFGQTEETVTAVPNMPSDELTFNELKDAHWLFDTPGIMKTQDILSLLTEKEVMSVVVTQAIIPRTFVLKPSTSLLVGGLARIDFLQGGKSCWFSVMASSQVPVHITSLDKADGVYQKHAGEVLLGVPMGGPERMRQFPAFVPQDLRLEGRGYLEAAADITLSSAGWVAVTAAAGEQLLLRLHGPQAAAFRVRTPPLLPHLISLKGARIRKSAAYKTIKPAAAPG